MSVVGLGPPRPFAGVSRSSAPREGRYSVNFFQNFVATRAEPELRGAASLRNRRVQVGIALGVLYQNQFNACVRKTDESFIRYNLETQSILVACNYYYHHPLDVLARYDILCPEAHRPGAQLRVVTDYEHGTVIRCEIEYNVAREDLPAQGEHYDLRAYVNVAIDLFALTDALSGSAAPDGWSAKREKIRTVLLCKDAPAWLISTALVSDANGEDTCEVDAELDIQQVPGGTPRDRSEWLSEAAQSAWRSFVQRYCTVHGIGRDLGPCSQNPLLVELSTVCDPLRQGLVTLISQAYGINGVPSGQFRGVVPTALTKEACKAMVSSDTVVSCKVVGHRVQMIVHLSRVYLFTRAGAFYSITQKMPETERDIVTAFSVQGGGSTVLDCELVCRDSSPRHVLLVFDVLLLHGKPCAGFATFRWRLEAFRSLTDRICALDAVISNKETRLRIGVKEFVPLKFYGRLWTNLSSCDGNGRRRATVAGFSVPVDGLVFVDLRQDIHYKWKPPSSMAVDFVAEQTMQHDVFNLELTASGTDLITVVSLKLAPPQMRQHHWMMLDAELLSRRNAHDMRTKTVMECVMNRTTGRWNFVRFRTDKTCPDQVAVAMQTLAVQGSNVTHRFIVQSIIRVVCADYRRSMRAVQAASTSSAQ